ncbi:MAG: lamin tail domain-containing protein [Candidatus Gracilibacteria bacterium]|jgi:hypothetical protein
MQQIIISEVLPNPKGSDLKNEWIELFNTADSPIDLTGHKITSGKNKISLDGKMIDRRSFLVVDNFRIQLRNSDNEVALIDPKGGIIDKVSYKEAKEGLSLALVKIKVAANTTSSIGNPSTQENSTNTPAGTNKTGHLFTNPTKNAPNPTLIELIGTVETEPQIAEDFYFTLSSDNKSYKITFPETFKFELMETTLLPGTKIAVLAQAGTNFDSNSSIDLNSYKLQNYEIIEPANPAYAETEAAPRSGPSHKQAIASSNNLFWLSALIIIIIITLLYLSWRYKPLRHNPFS